MSTEAAPTLAVVGRSDVIAPFRAAGLAAVPVEPGPGAAAAVQALIESGCRVVFYTEDLFPQLLPLLERYRRAAVPSLVALPVSAERYGIERLKDIVRRAVGADVFHQ